MGLSCDCGIDDYEWYYEVSDDTNYAACSSGKCYGCGGQIKVGDEVAHIWSWEMDENGEERPWENIGRICEKCWGHYESLKALGFCMTADWGFIKEAIWEYQTDFVPIKHKITTRSTA